MKLKNLIFAVTVLFTALLITIISYFAAFAITVLLGDVNVSNPGTASVDQGIFNLIRFILSLMVFSGWYKAVKEGSFFTDNSKRALKFTFHPASLLLIIILGFSIQICTDGALYILSKIFTESFSSYNSMMEEFSGSTSVLFIFTAVVMAPVVEELVFRGLTLHYTKKAFNLVLANIIQALLFGLYHGNLIQGIYAFIFGLLLGYIAIKTDSLITGMLLHMIINGSLYIVSRSLFTNIGRAALITMIAFSVLTMSYALILIIFDRRVSRKPSE